MVELHPETGQSRRAEQHHIASNECLWEDVRHHHVGSRWGSEPRYQIGSEFEGEQVALQVRPLTETSLR